MNRIDSKLKKLMRDGKKAVSVFLTAGFPSVSMTEKLILELESSGADMFEIGFPFSDPIADGPTIQKSSEESLRSGMTWEKLLSLVKRIRQKSQVPLVLMTYSNALFCRGWERSAREIARAGFDGAIIPDMNFEESRPFGKILKNEGLHLIHLAAPTSSLGRISKIAKASRGFLYCVSVAGVTGARKSLSPASIQPFLKSVRSQASAPVLLGFGISQPSHLKAFKKTVDGVIIGSALIKILSTGPQTTLIQRAKKFMNQFDKAR